MNINWVAIMNSINWGEVITKLFGDAVIFIMIGFGIQWLIHRQTIQLEKAKRKDYIACRNHDKLSEALSKMSGILLEHLRSMPHYTVSRTGTPIDIFDAKITTSYNGENKDASLSELFYEYFLFFPKELSESIVDLAVLYHDEEYQKVNDKTLEIFDWMKDSLHIKSSREELKKIFDVMSQDKGDKRDVSKIPAP